MCNRVWQSWQRWRLIGLVLMGLLLQPTMVAAGGWLTCTLEALPADPVAGQQQTISFSLRQHGQHLIAGQAKSLEFTHPASGERLTVSADDEPGRPGYYRAVVSLPQPGLWRWTIQAWAEHPMPSLMVSPPPASATSPVGSATTRPATVAGEPSTGSISPVAALVPVFLVLATILALVGLGCLLQPTRSTWRPWTPG